VAIRLSVDVRLADLIVDFLPTLPPFDIQFVQIHLQKDDAINMSLYLNLLQFVVPVRRLPLWDDSVITNKLHPSPYSNNSDVQYPDRTLLSNQLAMDT
jgi:hypothetical protein